MGIENDTHSYGQLPLIATAALKTEYSNPISESNSANIPMQPIVESRDAATMSPCSSICGYADDLANNKSLAVTPSGEEGGGTQKLMPADRSDATEQRDEPELPPEAVAVTSTASIKSNLSCDSRSEPRVTLITVTSKHECALDIQGVGSSYSVDAAKLQDQATTQVPETATRAEEKTTQVEETPAGESEVKAAMSIETRIMLLEEKLSLLEETATGEEEKTARAEEKTTQVEKTPAGESEVKAAMSIETKMSLLEEKLSLLEETATGEEEKTARAEEKTTQVDETPADESEVKAAMSIETKLMLLEEKLNILEGKMMIAEVKSKPDLPVEAETDIEPPGKTEVEPGSSNDACGKKKKKKFGLQGIKSGSPAKSGLEVEPFDEEKKLSPESVSANKFRLFSKPPYVTPMSTRRLPSPSSFSNSLSSFSNPSPKEMLCSVPSILALRKPRLGKNSDKTVSATAAMQSKDTKEVQMDTIGLGDDEKLESPQLQPAVEIIESNSMQAMDAEKEDNNGKVQATPPLVTEDVTKPAETETLEIAIADKSTNSPQSENKEFFKSDVLGENAPLSPDLHDKLMTNTKEETTINEAAVSTKSVTSERPSTPKKLDEVVAAASDMKPQPFERPNVIEKFLSTFDCMCGAPKLSNKTINEEDPSKESSTTVDLPVVHDPIVTEVVPSSGELNVPSKESVTADLPAIRDPIVAEESNSIERSNSLNSITTDFADDAFSAEKINEARLDEAAKMANKALDEKEKMNKKKTKFSFGLSSKLVKIRTLNQRTSEMKSVAGHYMRTKKHDFKTQKETVELANSQSL